ncbi:hypothetical protein B0T18DRAFT_401797 [Schizothecium vesticola]|uniref:Secreted protein n=1 Tax=Schizothecium vesticola TaxID=314040 RepID=A0AA40F4Z8_9PEZI|nr:hypothetical protein B0T18DRAFT_401797 [Schizothecium vesticola]
MQKRLQDADAFLGLLLRALSLSLSRTTRAIHWETAWSRRTLCNKTSVRATCDGCQTRWRAAARKNVGNISETRGEDRRNTWE